MSNLASYRRLAACALIVSGLLSTPAAAQPASPGESAASFVEAWMDLWNGRVELADSLIADDFTLHATMLDGSSSAAVDTPGAFAGWVSASRSPFPDLVFEPVVGPMVSEADGGALSVAVHWEASGTYAGGLPFAAAAPGTMIRFSGTDVVRVVEGQVTDYWLVTDTLALFGALGIGGAEASN